jgi:acetyl esterase/lipase
MALTLDLYEPAGDRARNRPAVLWVHGGGFSVGNSANPNMVVLARAFAARGYVAASINYRLLRGAPCGGQSDPGAACANAALAAKHDAQAAVRWMRSRDSRLRIDKSRVGIGGSSAGGVTALLVGTGADDVGDSGNPGERSSVGATVSISGGLPGRPRIDGRDAPALFFHGTNDPTVPYDWARANADAYAQAGVPVVLETLTGAGHVPFAEYRSRFIAHSAYFLYARLRLRSVPLPSS